jgi:hypothetical protein
LLIGWYWRPKVTPASINGAPSIFSVKNIQIPKGSFILLAIAYPANAQFQVYNYNI